MHAGMGLMGLVAGTGAGALAWRWAAALLARMRRTEALPPRAGACAACGLAWAGVCACAATPAEALELSLVCCVLVTLSLTDLAAFVIPDACTLAAALVRVGYVGLVALGDVPGARALALRSVVGAVVAFVPLLALVLALDRLLATASMGGGDLKLLAVAGSYVGARLVPVLLLLACAGGIAFSLARARGRRSAPEPFAFGPAIAWALWLTLLVGGSVEPWLAAWVF